MILIAYCKALLSPSGRLPRTSYSVISAALILLHALAWRMVQSAGADDVYGVYGGLLFLVMWMQFCIISRRMHDVGRTNQLAVGLFMLIVFSYLATLDPRLLGKDEDTQEYWGEILVYVNHLVRLGWMFISVELLKQDGESGANMYGPEFGMSAVRAARKERANAAIDAAYGATKGIARGRAVPAKVAAPMRVSGIPASRVARAVVAKPPVVDPIAAPMPERMTPSLSRTLRAGRR